MSPQKRNKATEPSAPPAEGRRRAASVKKSRAQQESRRLWLKMVLLLMTSAFIGLFLLWSYKDSEEDVTEVLAHHSETVRERFFEVPCSEDYENHKRFAGCTPRKCGRAVTDALITKEEAETIQGIAERGLSLGGSDGGASILDLHSGALSMGTHFVNMYRYFGDAIKDTFSEEDFQLYRDVRQRIQLAIAQSFGISSSTLYLTKPTFFSRMNSTEAKTAHDEYWHPHIDKTLVTQGNRSLTSGASAPPSRTEVVRGHRSRSPPQRIGHHPSDTNNVTHLLFLNLAAMIYFLVGRCPIAPNGRSAIQHCMTKK